MYVSVYMCLGWSAVLCTRRYRHWKGDPETKLFCGQGGGTGRSHDMPCAVEYSDMFIMMEHVAL